MNMLYDSDNFSVVHTLYGAADDAAGDQHPALAVQQGFEIVDKRSGKGIYLDGLWAEQFQAQVYAWQQDQPTQEEVEDTLAGYAVLAQNPVLWH